MQWRDEPYRMLADESSIHSLKGILSWQPLEEVKQGGVVTQRHIRRWTCTKSLRHYSPGEPSCVHASWTLTGIHPLMYFRLVILVHCCGRECQGRGLVLCSVGNDAPWSDKHDFNAKWPALHCEAFGDGVERSFGSTVQSIPRGRSADLNVSLANTI